MGRKATIRVKDGYEYVDPADIVSVKEIYGSDLTEEMANKAGYPTAHDARKALADTMFTVITVNVKEDWRLILTIMSPEQVAEEVAYASDMNKIRKMFLTASTTPNARFCVPVDEVETTEDVEVEEVVHVRKKRVIMKSGKVHDFPAGAKFQEVERLVDRK